MMPELPYFILFTARRRRRPVRGPSPRRSSAAGRWRTPWTPRIGWNVGSQAEISIRRAWAPSRAHTTGVRAYDDIELRNGHGMVQTAPKKRKEKKKLKLMSKLSYSANTVRSDSPRLVPSMSWGDVGPCEVWRPEPGHIIGSQTPISIRYAASTKQHPPIATTHRIASDHHGHVGEHVTRRVRRRC